MAGVCGKLYAVWRGLASLTLFAAFGAGSLLLTLIVLLLRKLPLCHPVMRAFWKLTVFLFKFTGLISVDCPRNAAEVRGSIIVANHPSLIDVVLLTVLVPRTLFVAKHALLRNPFVSAIVRHTSLPDDERLPAAAAPYLAAGWNVLIFPEGTRSAGPRNLRCVPMRLSFARASSFLGRYWARSRSRGTWGVNGCDIPLGSKGCPPR